MSKPKTYAEQIFAAIRDHGPKLSLYQLKRHVAEMRGGDTYVEPRFHIGLRAALKRAVDAGELKETDRMYSLGEPSQKPKTKKNNVKNRAPAWLKSTDKNGWFKHPTFGPCKALVLGPDGSVQQFEAENGRLTISVDARGDPTGGHVLRAS
jgi:hypothetical protein